MMIGQYEVRKDAHYGYSVFEDGFRVAGPLTSKALADAKADAMVLAKRSKQRKCMCCGTSFLSEGPHHRLCSRCRHVGASAEDVAV